MNLLAIKLFLNKSWLWIKHHWKMLFLFAWTFIIWFVSRKNTDAAMKVLDATKYNSILDQIEDAHKSASQQLKFDKRARIKEIVNQYHNDPSNLNKTLLDEFGFEYVE